MDIFDQHAPIESLTGEAGYGSSGEMKKTQYVLQLLGTPWDPETLKCIIAAAEQGMELQSGYLDTLNAEQDSSAYREISAFGVTPSLKEADYHVTGSNGILAFINARGLGYSLIPKNVNLSSEQDYWIDIAVTEASPKVESIVQQQILGTLGDSAYQSDEAAIAEAKETLVPVLDLLDKQLEKQDGYIVSKYSMADVHWTPIIHLLSLTDASDLIQQRPNIQRWYDSLKTKKSNCGQGIVSFSLLPSKEDIQNKKLPVVEIDDF